MAKRLETPKDQAFNSIISLLERFPDEEACKAYFAEMRWHGKPVCPYCNHDKVYTMKRYKCAKCRKTFNVTVGSPFEDSKIPLRKWFLAIYLITSHKKGISSMQLAKDIKVTQKTAWYMCHRIRHNLSLSKTLEPFTGVVQVDEMYVGGKPKKGDKKFDENGKKINKAGRGTKKVAVVGIVEANGKIVIKPVRNTDRSTLHNFIKEHVEGNATIITDEYRVYKGLDRHYNHLTINHSLGQYSVDGINTNTIEGFWGFMKRGIVGIYHYVSPKHLDLYCDEFTYRYSTRLQSEVERFNKTLEMSISPLSYSTLTSKNPNRYKKREKNAKV